MSNAKIQLSNGVMFDLLEPDPELVEIEPIAHSLSQLCRFTGHCAQFYSVAQHCVVVSRLVPAENALEGLLHDATEAFVGDVSTPLKRMLSQYIAIEDRIAGAIAERFGVALPGPEVKHADKVALATERRDLGLPGNDEYWKGLPEPARFSLTPLDPPTARVAFLARFAEIQLHPGQGQLEEVTAKGYARRETARERHERLFETNKDRSERLAHEEADHNLSWMEVIG